MGTFQKAEAMGLPMYNYEYASDANMSEDRTTGPNITSTELRSRME